MARRTAEYSFTINQGANLNTPLVWSDAAGDPIDITGYTARLVARENVVTDPILLDMNTTNGQITVGTTDGLITLILTAAESAALDFDKAKYQLEVTSGSGFVTRLMEGQVTLSKELVVV